MLCVLLVTVLANLFVCFTCLQHGIEYPFLFHNFTFWALLLTIVFVQGRSNKFLFLPKDVICDSGNTSLNSLFICNRFQCFFTTSYTIINQGQWNSMLRFIIFCVSRSSLLLSNVFDILSCISVFSYHLSIIFFDKMSQLALKSRSLILDVGLGHME